jgi:hypothetical protein
MAPEQARGEPLDPRTDLFSLGSVLYMLCTGQFPFHGATNAEVLDAVVNQTPVPIARLQKGIPQRLIEIIDRLHAKDRTERYKSADEVASALGAILNDPAEKWAFVPTVEVRKLIPSKPRRRIPRIAVAAMIFLLIGGLIATEVTGITHLRATAIDYMFHIRSMVRTTLGDEMPLQVLNSGRESRAPVRMEPPPVPTTESPTVVARMAGHQGPVRNLAVSRDGKWLLSGSGWPQGDRSIRLWDLASSKEVRRFDERDDQIYAVAFSPDSALALSGGKGGKARLWDVKTGMLVRTCGEDNGPIFAATFAPDGKTFIAAGGDGKICHYNVETGELLRTFEGHIAPIISAVFSPDGKRIASGAQDATARIWDVETGKEVHQLGGHQGWVGCVAFSPDGHTVAAGAREIRLFDVRSGKLIRELDGHKFGTNTVTYSPDGHLLISGGYDTVVRIWDPTTGRQLDKLVEHKDWVWSLVVTPDGKQFLSAGGGIRRGDEYFAGTDFAIRIWKLPTLRPEK